LSEYDDGDAAAEEVLELLAAHLRLIEPSQRKFHEHVAPHFNPVDLASAETLWSAAIAQLLDPTGTHGQGRLFLDAFIKELGLDLASYGGMGASIRVGTEKWLGSNGRIDIRIEFLTGRRVIGIEAKINAGDQPGQLGRYNDAFRGTHYVNVELVYLTTDGREPSLASLGEIDPKSIRRLSYGRVSDHEGTDPPPNIANAFRSAVPMCRADRVRWYVMLLNEALDGLSGTKEEAEDPRMTITTQLLIGNPERLRTAHLIRDALKETQYQLISAFGEAIRRRMLDYSKSLVVVDNSLVDDPRGDYPNLRFLKPNWRDVRMTLGIENGSNRFGICYEGDVEPPFHSTHHDEVFQELGEALKRKDGGSDEWWPIYFQMPWPYQNPFHDEAQVAMCEVRARGSTPEFEDLIDDLVRVAEAFDRWHASRREVL
jgi:PD-(D/E)XK nuclease superfamily